MQEMEFTASAVLHPYYGGFCLLHFVIYSKRPTEALMLMSIIMRRTSIVEQFGHFNLAQIGEKNLEHGSAYFSDVAVWSVWKAFTKNVMKGHHLVGALQD